MYSERLLDHFRNPRNVGQLPPPAVTVDAANPACGDMLRLSARFEDDRVASFSGEPRNLDFAQIVWALPGQLRQFDFLEGDLAFIKKLAGPVQPCL